MKGNTKTKTEFILYSVFYTIISMSVYRKNLFKVLPLHSLLFSKNVLWLIIIISISGCFAMTFKKNRNTFSMLSPLFIGYCTYSALAYDFLRYYVVIFLSIATAIFFILALVLFRNKKYSLKFKLMQSSLNAQRIVALAFAIILLPLSCKAIFNGTILRESLNKCHY